MKILFVSSLKITDICGVISHIKSLGKGFEKLGHDVDYLTASSIPRSILILCLYGPLTLLWKFKNVRTIYSEILLIFFFSIVILFKQIFNKYDLICIQDYTTFIPSYLIRKIYKIPIVRFDHSYISHTIEFVGIRRDSIVGRFLMKEEEITLNHVDLIIPVDSRIEKDLYSFGINRGKIRKMINFVDVDEFKPRVSKNLFGLPNKKIILCPRRVVDKKNGVIYAVKSMKYITDDVILVITGNKGEEVENIKKTIEKDKIDDKVLLLPTIPYEKVKYLYNEAEIVVIPSINYLGLEEATSISALEGMASEKIVIASNIGGLKEIIQNGITGFLVPEKDPKALAEKITEVLHSDTRKIRKNARKFVVENCSNTKKAEEFLKIYGEFKKEIN